MKKEKEKNKICIIGHTKGIGKAIADISKFEVVGLSRANGYDLSGNLENIMDKIDECEYVVINAYAKSYLNLAVLGGNKFINDKNLPGGKANSG